MDPDLGLEEGGRREPLSSLLRGRADILVVVALGGAIGSLGRWGLAELLPSRPGEFAWATFLVNVSGSFLLGLLMVLLARASGSARLVGPFLGTGLLGGWTTFSTAMQDTSAMLDHGRVVDGALPYLAGSLVLGLAAAALGLALGRVLLGRRRPGTGAA